jgi:hypothetical protein
MRAEDIYEIIKDMPPPKNEQDLGNVVDDGTPLPEPSEGLEIQIEEGEDEIEETGEDEYDDTSGESGEEGDSGEGEDGEGGEDGESGEDGEESEGGEVEYKVYQAQAGDLIKSKDGRYGKITSVNSDGTHDIDEMTEEEVKAERASSVGKSSISDLGEYK